MGSLGVIYSQKSSSNFQMLMIGSENFVIMKNMQNKRGLNAFTQDASIQ